MELAISIASSKRSNSMRLTTGPNTSSRAMRMVGVALTLQRAASAQQFRATLHSNVDVLRRGLDLSFVYLRTHFHRLVEAVADLERLGARDQPLREFARNALLQQDAAGGCAALPSCAEGSPQCAIERKIEIGVVEDDLRVLAAHLKRNRFKSRGRALAYP